MCALYLFALPQIAQLSNCNQIAQTSPIPQACLCHYPISITLKVIQALKQHSQSTPKKKNAIGNHKFILAF